MLALFDTFRVRTLTLICLACVIALMFTACGGSLRHIATGGSTALADGLIGVQTTADRAVQAGTMTVSARRQLATHLAPALVTGRAINTAILNWTPGSPMPQNLVTLISNMQGVTSDLAGAFTDPTAQALAEADIASASAALLSILALAGQ